MSPDPRETTRNSVRTETLHEPEPMAEGEEPPPPGVAVMAAVRWALLGFAAVLAIFAWWSYASAEQGGAASDAQVGTRYHCPMHPQIISNEPGECPICHMQLEPISAERSAVAPIPSAAPAGSGPAMHSHGASPGPQGTGKNSKPSSGAPTTTTPGMTAAGTVPPGTTPIKLTLDRIQSIGVRTAVAGEGTVSPVLRVTAIVAPPEQGAAEVHVRSPGFVEQIYVNQTGITVRRDQALFALYSPEILQAQSELLVTQQWSGGASAATAGSARRKLELLGMSGKDIDQVAKTRETMRAIPVYAAHAGYVAQKNLVAGSYVTPEMVLYTIQDLSHVYVLADVFQQDIGVVQVGTIGRFIPTRQPDLAVEAQVDLVYPTLNAEARTTRVRMQIRNAKGRTFRPGEYGAVEFETRSRTAVTVPRDAIVDTGLHVYAFVVEGEGVFSPREVTIGGEHGETVTISEGISKGERVVSGATFLIDSESRLQAAAMQTVTSDQSEPQKPSSQEGLSCDQFDRTKYPDKWTECQKCAQIHRGMGSMEADCKNAIPKPWR